MVTKEKIARTLTEIGVGAGDICLFHSSFKSLGTVEGGAQAELDSPASAAHWHTLKQVVAFYQENKTMFLYGRLLDVVQCGPETVTLDWEIDEVGRKTQTIPAVEAALWETADGKQRVAAYNFSDADVTVSVFGKTITIGAKAFRMD